MWRYYRSKCDIKWSDVCAIIQRLWNNQWRIWYLVIRNGYKNYFNDVYVWNYNRDRFLIHLSSHNNELYIILSFLYDHNKLNRLQIPSAFRYVAWIYCERRQLSDKKYVNWYRRLDITRHHPSENADKCIYHESSYQLVDVSPSLTDRKSMAWSHQASRERWNQSDLGPGK